MDRWLADKAKTLSTRTLREIHSCLNRSIKRAMARDKVKRNVVALCGVPKGRTGRPSKSLTLDQAKALLERGRGRALYAYIVALAADRRPDGGAAGADLGPCRP